MGTCLKINIVIVMVTLTIYVVVWYSSLYNSEAKFSTQISVVFRNGMSRLKTKYPEDQSQLELTTNQTERTTSKCTINCNELQTRQIVNGAYPQHTGHVSSTVLETTPLYVRLLRKRGRFGNHMFQYASLLGIARRNNRTPIWSGNDTVLRSMFTIKMQIDDEDVISNSNGSRFVIGPRERRTRCYENLTENLPARNVSMDGYRQSRLYFSNVEAELRTHFTFTDSFLDEAKSIMNKALSYMWNCSWNERRNKTFVAFHVRRGDLLEEKSVNHGLVQPSPDYYRRAMDYFNIRYRDVMFILLSDDMAWCRKNILAPNLAYLRRRSRYVEMAVASLCDHAIVTQGTFGLWIAWFADGVTVRPKNVPAPGSYAFKMIYTCGHSEHYFPRRSIVL